MVRTLEPISLLEFRQEMKFRSMSSGGNVLTRFLSVYRRSSTTTRFRSTVSGTRRSGLGGSFSFERMRLGIRQAIGYSGIGITDGVLL